MERLSRLFVVAALVAGCDNSVVTADAVVTPDAPVVSGCGWDGEQLQFRCGTTARAPMGEPFVTCSGESCTHEDPGAMCFSTTCDYATGTLTTCSYRAGTCPCTPVVCD